MKPSPAAAADARRVLIYLQMRILCVETLAMIAIRSHAFAI